MKERIQGPGCRIAEGVPEKTKGRERVCRLDTQRMYMRHWLVLSLAALLAGMSAKAAGSKTDATAAPPATAVATGAAISSNGVSRGASAIVSMDLLDDKRKLGIGDLVSYRVIEDREDAKPLRVAESGDVDIPYLGRFSATNKTCKQLAGELKKVLETDLYFTATVIVALDLQDKVREKESPGKVDVIGQVRGARSIPIPGDEPFTVSKAILAAGGFSDFANRRKVKLTRKPAEVGRKPLTFTIDVTEIWEKGKSQYDLSVEPGDTIFVPARLVNF